MKKIAYERSDGGVTILNLAPKDRVALVLPQVAGMTEDEYVEFIRNKDVPADAVTSLVIEDSDIEADDADRDAWEIKNGKVKVNSQKKAQKDAEKAQKKAEKDAVLNKLGITEEEFKKLRK